MVKKPPDKSGPTRALAQLCAGTRACAAAFDLLAHAKQRPPEPEQRAPCARVPFIARPTKSQRRSTQLTTQRLPMVSQMVGDEALDEVVAVIVADMPTQSQRLAGLGTSCLKALGL